jgi:hypothetical protein
MPLGSSGRRANEENMLSADEIDQSLIQLFVMLAHRYLVSICNQNLVSGRALRIW